MTAQKLYTRFRAYQLGTAGSSFSYFADDKFTLIEARVTDLSRPNLQQEIIKCGKEFIDTLHITSWDQDHCAVEDLQEILSIYKPLKIEHPGYNPQTDSGKESKSIIEAYTSLSDNRGRTISCTSVTPEYVKSLDAAKELGYNDVVYWPKYFSSENTNDNSIVKLFRGGCFNIVSLGDVEDENIGSLLRRSKMFIREMDVLILAHHGADCPTNSKRFFQKLKPRLTVCSSNFDNQFEHPRSVVRERLRSLGIPLYTTKTGDIIIQSLPPHDSGFKAYNLEANSTRIASEQAFETKKYPLLSMNMDTIRNVYKGKPTYRSLK